MSKVTNRNITFSDASHIIWEGSHTLLYRSGTDNFGKAMYNIAILKYTTWMPEPVLYWASYTTGHGAYGINGIDNLIEAARRVNEQAKLVHENINNIEEVVRLCKEKKVGTFIAGDITGYYISDTGFFVGPKGHKGTVD
jgi:hypothetical protein